MVNSINEINFSQSEATIIHQPKPKPPKIEFLVSKDPDQPIINEGSDREETPDSPDIDITQLISLGDFIAIDPPTLLERIEECYQKGVKAEENGHKKQAMFYYFQVGEINCFHKKANEAFKSLRWPK